ncbi:MAG: hypothetical protein IPM50_05750 [Acidobacteriota bacterium]|nr:MAG: hypothetical protein IPM50_05750 [Acidobacteriota bacterium]
MATGTRKKDRKTTIERVPARETDSSETLSIRNAGDISIEIYLSNNAPRVFSFAGMQNIEIREIPGVGFVLVGKY